MRVGILCEGADTDAQVIRAFVEHLFPRHTFDIKGVSKRWIFEMADLELATLFEDGAERALIIWDLLPIGQRMTVASQWSEKAHPNGGDDLFKLVCICYTAESWFLADEGVLVRLATHQGHIPRCKSFDPDTCSGPENELKRFFAQSRHPRLKFYNKAHHNALIAQAYIDDQRVRSILRRSSSFKRAVQAITDWLGE